MDILPSLKAEKPTLSFEFFPPKNKDASADLLHTVRDLQKLNPSFVSVTYGAGGTTRDLTHELVRDITHDIGIHAVPHLTCISHSEEEIDTILKNYAHIGATTILALRGDPPRDNPDYDRSQDHFLYAADLVRFIKESPHASFTIGIAGFPEGHPATPNRLIEMDHFKNKVDAGADYITTQLFFDNHDFFDYRERCELAGIHIPIVAGVMPLTSLTSMKRMAELAEGSRFPAKLIKTLEKNKDNPDDLIKAGIDYATEQCQELIDGGVHGIHLYTLNKSDSTRRIAQALSY